MAAEDLIRQIELLHKLGKFDNPKLAWMLLTFVYDDIPFGSIQDLIISECVNRLYPEYDGTKIEWTEAGWKTPEGEIKYVEAPETATENGGPK